MAKTISIKDSQATYAAAIEQFKSTGEPLVVEQDGKPVVVVISYAEYQQLAALRGKKELSRQVGGAGFERERAAFLRLKPELLKTHRGLYVAIHDEQVADSDADNLALAKRIAEKRIQPVYVQLVSEELPVYEISTSDAELEKPAVETWREQQELLLSREIAAYERMKPDLLKTHKGKWVSILNGQLVDSDDNRQLLSKRVREKFGDKTMLIEQVRDARICHGFSRASERMKYNDSALDPPAPMVDVVVRPVSQLEPVHVLPGKLDTGADMAIIPLSLVAKMRLPAKFRMLMRGYDGVATERLGYEVDMELAGYKLESVQVIAAPRANVLLGRDILNHFIITLDGKAQTFEMIDP